MFKYKRIDLFIALLLFCILLSACGPSPEELAATSAAETAAAATSTPTITPTYTPTTPPTATNTPVPSDTPKPTLTPTPAPDIIDGPERPRFLLIPTRYIKVETWKGIPIMPEAIAGDEEYGGFYYSVENTVTEVREYYQQELGKFGWSLSAFGEAENGDIKLLFQNGVDQVTITVYVTDNDFEHSLFGFQAPASFVLIVH